MFQFRRFPPYTYLIQYMVPEYCSGGSPHSEIRGSKLICSSPRLIAAYHVFLRLPVPRHSPCALFSLTVPKSPFDDSQLFRFSICQRDLIKIVVLIFSHFAVSCYSVFKVHPRLAPRLPSTPSKCILPELGSVLESPKVDGLYSAFASYKHKQASQLSGASRLESRNALMAYTSYKRVSCLSSFTANGGLKWTRTTDLALIRRAL